VTRDDFLAAVKAEFDVEAGDAADRVLLDAALATVDEIARLEDSLRDGTVLVTSERGNVRANPAFAELRRHRESLAKLTRQLFDKETPTTQRARRAANARWSR
jgi:hypothetical protein